MSFPCTGTQVIRLHDERHSTFLIQLYPISRCHLPGFYVTFLCSSLSWLLLFEGGQAQKAASQCQSDGTSMDDPNREFEKERTMNHIICRGLRPRDRWCGRRQHRCP